MEDRSLASIARELVQGFSTLVQSEIHLAKTEMTQHAKIMGKQSTMTLVFAGIAVLGVLAWLAFLIIGLGILFQGRYWLSAFLVGTVFVAVGGLVVLRSLRKMKNELQFPATQHSLEGHQHMLSQKIHDLSEARNRFRRPTSPMQEPLSQVSDEPRRVEPHDRVS